MPITALIARVPAAESLVSELRLRHDPSAAQGVPAHITVLVPFKNPAELSPHDALELNRIIAGHPSFSFTLGEVLRWPQTTALSPSPPAPFIELTNAIVRAFPNYRPYAGKHGEVIPHLTVADGSTEGAESAETELRALLLKHGPVAAHCQDIELIENSSGAWKVIHVFRLASSDAPRSSGAPTAGHQARAGKR